MSTYVAVDLEGTLTTGGVWRGVSAYLRRYHYWGRQFVYDLPNYIRDWLTQSGFGDRNKFKFHLLRTMPRMFKGFDEDQLAHLGQWVVENELWPKRRADVVKELRTIDERISIVIVSGAYDCILSAFGQKVRNRVDVLGTQLEIADGKATGRIYGEVNQGVAKVARLRRLVGDSEVISAYSDGIADFAMLEMSSHPVAVYPDSQLRKGAEERNWRILQADRRSVADSDRDTGPVS